MPHIGRNISHVSGLPGEGVTGEYSLIYITEGIDKRDVPHPINLIYPDISFTSFTNEDDLEDPIVLNVGENSSLYSCTGSDNSHIRFNGIPGITSIQITHSNFSGTLSFGSDINIISIRDSIIDNLILNNCSKDTIIQIVNSSVEVFDLTKSTNSCKDFNLIRMVNTEVGTTKFPAFKDFINENC